MNFIKAVQHATIGYGIRRKAWAPHAILSLGNLGEFYWLNDTFRTTETPVQLCGPDKAFDLQPHDLQATDWECI